MNSRSIVNAGSYYRYSHALVAFVVLVGNGCRDGASFAHAANVQVVFVAGQSNCQGLADKLHLFDLIDEGTEEFARYGPHNDRHIDGRDDVYVRAEPERSVTGPLDTRFGESNRVFGIEVGAGYELGDYFEEDDVVIVKHCEVSALAEDWLPPSASEGGNSPGSAFEAAMDTFRQTIDNIGDIVPGFDAVAGDTVELLGFVWIHGYADAYVTEYREAYGERLGNLLADVRDEFPGLKGQVVVQTGGGGEDPDEFEAELRQIQADVMENETARVSLVETSSFSGGDPKLDETYVHYFGRADNYIRIGEAIGDALVAFDATLPPTTLPTTQPTSSPTMQPTQRPTIAPVTTPVLSPTPQPQVTPPPIPPSTSPPPSRPPVMAPPMKGKGQMMKTFVGKGKGSSMKSKVKKKKRYSDTTMSQAVKKQVLKKKPYEKRSSLLFLPKKQGM